MSSLPPNSQATHTLRAAADRCAAVDRCIVALDVPASADALALTRKLEAAAPGEPLWLKVGLELYLAAGPTIVLALRDRGHRIFLDLKLHDIPNTVAGAVRSLASSGASLLTVHAAGGPAMLAAAAAAASPEGPQLLAVTVLTSMDAAQLSATGLSSAPLDQVLRLGSLASTAGVPGLVCSPQEVALLRAALGTQPLLIVPGIRPAGAATQDQRRVAIPAEALGAGASKLVIGRPVTQAADPAAAFAAVLAEIAAAL